MSNAPRVSENFSQWTPNQLKLIRWLALPSEMRKPRTHAEFASSIGVTERTIFNWKDLAGLKEAAGKLASEQVVSDLADIYSALVKDAKKGNLGHIKLCLEAAGHIASGVTGTNPGVNVQVNVDARKEDREQRFERLFADLDAHRARAGSHGDNGQSGRGVSVDSRSTNHTPT